MISRYNLMLESNQVDIDKKKFPDPLSINFNDFEFKKAPFQVSVEERFKDKLYYLTYKYYGKVELDDIILNINNVPHVSTLVESNEEVILYFPDHDDLNTFLTRKEFTF